jgi:6-phosphogluconolactonase (cycloisomerase 2 family)
MASPGTQCGVSHRKHLYVADEAGDAVKVFEVKTGRLVARIKGRRRTRPVHHILHRETLYVGAAGSGSILAFDIPDGDSKHRAACAGQGVNRQPSPSSSFQE